MSVVIRLARAGTKKRPVYHVVVADSRFPRDGRFIERLGHFNPLLPKDNETRLKLDMDKVKAWLAKGAQPSDRVMRFLDAAGVKKRETRSNAQKAVPRKERKAQAEAAAKAYGQAMSALICAALIGRAAVTTTGEALGRVLAIHNFGAGDIIEIAPPNGATMLLPFTNAVVPEVDLNSGRVVVALPQEIEGEDKDRGLSPGRPGEGRDQ